MLLFDLGGVLVEYTGLRDLAALLPGPASDAEIVERWARCPHTQAFVVGRITPADFSARFVDHWGIALAPDRFLEEFRSWSRCLLPGARELLAQLRGRFRVAALSNSNETHWDRNSKELGVTQLFDLAVSSHEVGLAKPDPAIYHVALDRLRVPPDAVVFFDDAQANVDAALGVGIRAFRVEGVEAVRQCLVREGLIG